jgi:putative transposase
MRLMDGHILIEPTAGILTMQSMLADRGRQVIYGRMRRLMRKANIYPVYPGRHLTVWAQKKYVYAYLLRELVIDRPNQVWAIDNIYIERSSINIFT